MFWNYHKDKENSVVFCHKQCDFLLCKVYILYVIQFDSDVTIVKMQVFKLVSNVMKWAMMMKMISEFYGWW